MILKSARALRYPRRTARLIFGRRMESSFWVSGSLFSFKIEVIFSFNLIVCCVVYYGI